MSVSTIEVEKHNTLTDLWVVINQEVWDITDFVNNHPGTPEVIMKSVSGKYTTDAFNKIHPNINIHEIKKCKYIGLLSVDVD